MKKNKIIYWVATGLFSAMITMAVVTMYFGNTAGTQEVFKALSFPAWLVLPLGIAKLLGVTAILFRKVDMLKEMAYTGFFFNLLLAIGAHLGAGDGEAFGPVIPLILLITSYIFEKKLSEA